MADPEKRAGGAPTLRDLEDSGGGISRRRLCLRLGSVVKGVTACVLVSSLGGCLHAEVTPNSGISLPHYPLDGGICQGEQHRILSTDLHFHAHLEDPET